MPNLRYVGPFVDGVYLESPKHGAYTVAQGETVAIVDEEFAASLLEQPSNWVIAEKSAKAKTPLVSGPPVPTANDSASDAGQESK